MIFSSHLYLLLLLLLHLSIILCNNTRFSPPAEAYGQPARQRDSRQRFYTYLWSNIHVPNTLCDYEAKMDHQLNTTHRLPLTHLTSTSLGTSPTATLIPKSTAVFVAAAPVVTTTPQQVRLSTLVPHPSHPLKPSLKPYPKHSFIEEARKEEVTHRLTNYQKESCNLRLHNLRRLRRLRSHYLRCKYSMVSC